MSISFHPYVRIETANGDMWMFPEGYNHDNEINLANRNAGWMLETLGFCGSEEMWDMAPVSIDLFETAVDQAIAGLEGVSEALPHDVSVGGRGALCIDIGLPEGYWNRRLDDMAAMVRYGRQLGATHVGWG